MPSVRDRATLPQLLLQRYCSGTYHIMEGQDSASSTHGSVRTRATAASKGHSQNPSVRHLEKVQPAPDSIPLRERLSVFIKLPSVRFHPGAAKAVPEGISAQVEAGALRRPAKSAEALIVHGRLIVRTNGARMWKDKDTRTGTRHVRQISFVITAWIDSGLF